MQLPKPFSNHAGPSEYVPTWVSGGIVARDSAIHGTGLFTSRTFARGEPLLELGGFLFSIGEVKAGLARPESLTGYSDEWYLGSPRSYPSAIDEYLNHSCDPNLWLESQVRVVARHAIVSGEELTIDYATFEIDDNWRMPSPCNCGAPTCRESVTGSDWRNEALQRRYGNHFLPCIAARSARAVPLRIAG
jgi:hypothetical protein